MMPARSVPLVEDSDEDFPTVRDTARLGGLTPSPIVRARSGGQCRRLQRGASRGCAWLVLPDLNTKDR